MKTSAIPLLGLAGLGAFAFAEGLTTRDGFFTVEQAERGKAVYDEFCYTCHPVEFYQAQLIIWEQASVGELFGSISVTMPSENPGGLTDQQYLDVLAYIFSITGSPPGEQELGLINMDDIEIVVK